MRLKILLLIGITLFYNKIIYGQNNTETLENYTFKVSKLDSRLVELNKKYLIEPLVLLSNEKINPDNQNQLDRLFVYYLKLFFGDEDIYIKNLDEIRNSSEKIDFKFEMNHENIHNKKKYSYQYYKQLGIFLTEIETKTTDNRSSTYEYYAFSPYWGPEIITISEKDELNLEYASILNNKINLVEKEFNSKTDSINSLSIKKKLREILIANEEDNLRKSKEKCIEDINQAYLESQGKINLKKHNIILQFRHPERIEGIESTPENRNFIELEDGNYSLKVENREKILNKGRYSLREIRNSNGDISFSSIDEKGVSENKKYILGKNTFKKNEFWTEISISKTETIILKNAEQNVNMSILKNNYKGFPFKSYVVEIPEYEVYILSKNGNPLKKILGRFKSVENISDNLFKLTDQNDIKYSLNLSEEYVNNGTFLDLYNK